jgi:hypothetical protein
MPDIREIKDPLIGQPEIYIAKIEFYGSDKRNKRNEYKIGGD